MEKEKVDSCWNEEPRVMVFDTDEILKEFCAEAEKIIVKLLLEHIYDSVTSHIRFYQEYKSGNIPMPEFYHTHVAVHYPDSPLCVGNALMVKKELLDPESYFMIHYPDLEQYLYFATSNYLAYTSMDKIPNHRESRPAVHSAPYKEHIMVALSILLNGRKGYVLMDIGCNVSFPVIVMADGKTPQIKPFIQIWGKGPVEQSFQLERNYIHWIAKNISENPTSPKNRWIYIAKKFTKLQEMEKRNRVYHFHCVMKRGLIGPEAGIFVLFGKDNGINVYIKASNEQDESLSLDVSFDYLSQTEYDNDNYEMAIANCATRMNMDANVLRGNMKKIAEIANDKPFLESMLKLNAEYIEITENCWLNEDGDN